MAGWYSSFNPFGNANDDQINGVLDNQSNGAGGTQTDWWAYDPSGKDKGLGIDGYHKRVGRTISDATGGSGYYTDSVSQQNLGANVATLWDMARTKAAAEGNINGASNPDTAKNYLKQYLKNYLVSGNLGTALGVAGPGSTGLNYKDAFGQINANAAAGTPDQQNWYKNASGSIESGLRALTNLQTGGGLRSAVSNTIGDVFDRAPGNNDRFWQDPNGGTYNPWGGSFASNLQAQADPNAAAAAAAAKQKADADAAAAAALAKQQADAAAAAAAAQQGNANPGVIGDTGGGIGGGAGGGHGEGGQQPLPYTYTGPGPDPATFPSQPAPTTTTVPGSPGMTETDASLSTDPMQQFVKQLTPIFTQTFGRAPTWNDAMDWYKHMQARQGDWQWMVDDMARTAPAQKYAQTHVAAPMVANAQDTQGAQAYYDWLMPNQSPEDWIKEYLSQMNAATQR
jgi:hypothetical protein